MRLPLNSGAYRTASIIAGAQRSVNLYPEVNSKTSDSPVSMTHYPCPGLVLKTQGSGSTWRGLYQATNGQVFGVLDNTLYYIASDFSLTAIGNIGAGGNPVSLLDNGSILVCVTGLTGFTVDLGTHAFAAIVDPAFLGADKVGYIDTFLLFNQPNTKNFYSTTSNIVTPFNPLYIAAKTSFPDILQTLLVVKHEIYLIGNRTTEVWFNAGAPTFPFEELQGTLIEHGTAAKYSACSHGIQLFWVSQDKDGQGTALMTQEYVTTKISTPAIDAEWSTYPTVSDAISMTYQQRGHTFWMIAFPTADKTWAYDLNSGEWHERVWLDGDGQEHRHRANCMCPAYGQILVGDYANGKLYVFSLSEFHDDNQPMTFRRGFPHLLNDGKRVIYDAFIADVECGNPTADTENAIFLRCSDDRGRTYGNALAQSFGDQGEYLSQPQWSRLGLARDRVFELFWSTALKTALNGAFIEMRPSKE